MSAVTISDTPITCFADLNKLSTSDLLAYYNDVTGKNTKQFLKRAKGMQQVWALIEPQLAQMEQPASMEVAESAQEAAAAEVALEQAEGAEEPAARATVAAASASTPSTAEEPVEGTASAEAKPSGLKARVDDLLVALASGPRTVAELAEALGMEQKKVRSTIDTARRVGHTIACVGRGTFALPEAAQ